MRTIITILGISAILLSYAPTTRAQSNNSQTGETTLSGDSLKTVEGRSINTDNYRTYIDDPKSSSSPTNGIKPYELRRQQQNVEVIPGVSIPVSSGDPQSEDPLEGDKSEKGFKLELGI